MKRYDFVMKLAELKYTKDMVGDLLMPGWDNVPTPYARGYINDAAKWLDICESLGMKPPVLDTDRCNAQADIYMFGGDPYQWDEDFEKDEKAMEAYKRRMEFKGLSPTERVERRKQAQKKLNKR